MRLILKENSEPCSGSRIAAVCLFGLAAWYLCAAYLLPMTQDEAYYLQWGRNLAPGYFDHPPGVALLSWFSSRLPWSEELNFRFATVSLSLMGAWLLGRLYRQLFPDSLRTVAAATLLGLGNLAALVCGFLTTPDAVLFFAWILALHEACAALQKQPWRWLTAGAATGLGLLGKFTMLLIGPVFLWALLAEGGQSLRRPWPWLGGVVALLIFLPNLLWNHSHGWITWKFQLRHGFALERPEAISDAGALAPPGQAIPSGPEHVLSSFFDPPEDKRLGADQRDTAALPAGPMDAFFRFLKNLGRGDHLLMRLADFAGAQLALPGFLLISLLGSAHFRFYRRKKSGKMDESEAETEMNQSARHLMKAAALVPLLAFGIIAFKGKVEANWPAVWLTGAAPFLVCLCRPSLRGLSGCVLLNLMLLLSIVLYTSSPWIRVHPGLDRILRETKGYRELTDFLKETAPPLSLKPQTIFADSYQMVSMLRYYAPDLRVLQWPGLTRDSEFVYHPTQLDVKPLPSVLPDMFRLVTREQLPAALPGFYPFLLEKMNACREGGLVRQLGWQWPASAETPCSPLHEWFVISYRSDRIPITVR